MSNKRITKHPVLGNLDNQTAVTFTFDGKTYEGYEGDTIASALLANGIRQLRVHEESGKPRGIYCNIGHCFECRVTIDEKAGVRACMTEVKEGMVVKSGTTQPLPLKPTEKNTEQLPRTYTEFQKQNEGSKEEDPHV
ncbi:sarcosine oxidase subunit alpha [Virgibacillus natechei]|uniref:Sarcosine oxidase subunit alpha n=1 Tax=Virgibacillus natechei TaxID=1216297 RepID=A0ABS4IDZ4_9BACI|nr:sarcosine oxidase subunit alpha [Virgibacillus natechei]